MSPPRAGDVPVPVQGGVARRVSEPALGAGRCATSAGSSARGRSG